MAKQWSRLIDWFSVETVFPAVVALFMRTLGWEESMLWQLRSRVAMERLRKRSGAVELRHVAILFVAEVDKLRGR